MNQVGFESWDLQICLTRLNSLIFNIFLNLKKIYYVILLFIFLALFLNKVQILSSFHIIYIYLVLCLWLFGYKFVFIYGSVVLMLNLIIIIVIKKKNCPTHESNPTQPNSRGLGWAPMMGWVGLNIFLTYHDRLGLKNSSTWPMHTSTCFILASLYAQSPWSVSRML